MGATAPWPSEIASKNSSRWWSMQTVPYLNTESRSFRFRQHGHVWTAIHDECGLLGSRQTDLLLRWQRRCGDDLELTHTYALVLGDIDLFCDNTGFSKWRSCFVLLVHLVGLVWDIAPLFNAMVVFGEHRYYGASLPYGNQSYAKPENGRVATPRSVSHEKAPWSILLFSQIFDQWTSIGWLCLFAWLHS